MSISAMIRRMGEAGATPEAIAIAVEEIEAVQFALEARKAGDRERKRRQREARKSAGVTGHSEPCHAHVTDTPSPLSPPLKDPQTPKITPPISPHPSVVARTKNLPPDGVSGAQWQAFLKLRSAKRQPLTEHGYGLLCGKLRGMAEHGFPPGDMIDLAIERGWTTVHEPKENGNGRAGNHKPSGWESAYLANTGEGQSV